MKTIISICIISLISLTSFSQSDTAKIEQYCEVIATPRVLSNKVTIDINYGEEKSIWRDTRLRNDEGKLKKFNTVVDALNYMGKDGWIFVNAFPVLSSSSNVYHYIFENHFTKAEVGE